MKILMACLLLATRMSWAAAGPTLDTAKIEQLTGLKGTLNEKENVFKVSYPRTDIQVTVAGVHMTPPMGLTAWAAFTPAGDQTAVMGDMVLLEDQVHPVMSAALESGLEVTALHNHFLGDSPRVMYMHIGGMGDQQKLAGEVGKVFAALKATSGGKGVLEQAPIDTAQSTVDPKPLDAILGAQGQMMGGVYKVSFGKITHMADHDMGNAMGVNTWTAIGGSDAKAVMDGDVAVYEDELQGVLKALVHATIHVVAIHHHMTHEFPRVIFLHYWGVGPARDLAKGLRTALDTQKK